MTVNIEKRTRASKLVLQREGVVSNLRPGPRLRGYQGRSDSINLPSPRPGTVVASLWLRI